MIYDLENIRIDIICITSSSSSGVGATVVIVDASS